MNRAALWRLSMFLLLPSCALAQNAVNLQLMPSGATDLLGYYAPQPITLSTTAPAQIKRSPANLRSPAYGLMNFHLASGAAQLAVIVDAPSGAQPKFYVDTNGNGDLTDNPPIDVTSLTPTVYQAHVLLPIGTAQKSQKVNVIFYWFHDDPSRAELKNKLFYYRDYALFGSVTLNGKSYKASLVDEFCSGDFTGQTLPADADMALRGSGVYLRIDANQDGKLEDHPGETFDVGKPFNIAGTTYEMADLTVDGRFKIVSSKQSVPWIQPPPNLNAGQPALAFTAQTMDGKTVNFPGDFKGRIVMLDFWATWCGPCMSEVPNLASKFKQFHDQGFDVVGITLDDSNQTDNIQTVMSQNSMTWPQIYEGKAWEGRLVKLYGVQGIPCPILVDGSTGKIITSDEHDLRGDPLGQTIAKALANRSAK